MIRGILMILPFTLTMCTAPITPPAQACSPPLDGSEFTCPPHDGVLEPVELERKGMRGDIDLRQHHSWMQMHNMFIENQRREKIESTMTQPYDAINNALNDYWNEQHGSNDTTFTQELL